MDAITKESLKIPESLEKIYIEEGWGEDFWWELPYDWSMWSEKDLKKYPILLPIVKWKKENNVPFSSNVKVW